MAPEIIQRKEYAGGPADIWALGVLFFAMLTGKFPYKGKTDKEVYANVQTGMFEFPGNTPVQAKPLIRSML